MRESAATPALAPDMRGAPTLREGEGFRVGAERNGGRGGMTVERPAIDGA